MENNKDFLGTQPVGKLLFKLAIPTVIAQLINMLYNIVDRIFIGHIPDAGSLALTGVGVTMPIIMIVSAFAGLVSSGGAPRASISMGKGDMDSAEQTLGGCFLLQVIVSIVLTVVLLLFGENLLLAFGASENTIEYAVSYLNIYAQNVQTSGKKQRNTDHCHRFAAPAVWNIVCAADIGHECICNC